MPFLFVLVATCCAAPLIVVAAARLIRLKRDEDVDGLMEERRKAAKKRFEG